jgi:hypothetical protein
LFPWTTKQDIFSSASKQLGVNENRGVILGPWVIFASLLSHLWREGAQQLVAVVKDCVQVLWLTLWLI